jgi:purine-nucleoside phosphorylase
MEGRHHYYEARSYSGILNPLRAAAALGVRLAVLTNSAGAIRPTLKPGDLVLISDHLLVQGLELPALLQGIWPDTERAGYWEEGRRVMLEAARRTGVSLEEGTLACLTGPTYETRSEVEMTRRWGADIAAMSLAPEALAAQALGMRVVGLSMVTNRVGAADREPTEHREVVATARRFQPSIDRLLREAVPRLSAARDGAGSSG